MVSSQASHSISRESNIERRAQILRGDYSTTTWKEEVAHANQTQPVCSLKASTNEEKAPVPVILMCLSRSGSSATWQIMGELTGRATQANELTGSRENQNRRFFSHMELHNHGNWAMRWLCQEQEKYPDAGMVGFQWKPYGGTFLSEPSLGALKMIAVSHDPSIKVVRLRRNLLDKAISDYKHATYKNVPSHCKIGHEKCISKHQEAMAGLRLPVDVLMKSLYKDYEEEALVDKILVDLHVPHIQVSYEKLYFGEDIAQEWMRIFKFLGVGPTEGLKKEEIFDSMSLAPTGNAIHNETLQNYHEIRDALLNTIFENLLH